MKILMLVSLCIVATACGSSGDSPGEDGGADAGGSTAASTDGGGGSGGSPATTIASTTTTSTSGEGGFHPDPDSCSAIENVAEWIEQTTTDDPLPTMTGGTIVDGTYVLTAVTRFPGNPFFDASWRRSTHLVENGHMEDVSEFTGHPGGSAYSNFTVDGVNLVWEHVCDGYLDFEFTATETTLILYSPEKKHQLTLTRL